MLFGCISVPDFAVQAALEGSIASFLTEPAAVLEGPDSMLKVIACNEPARAAGVSIGMTRLQAESCGAVRLEQRAIEQEESAQEALLACAYKFSPRMESTAPGTVIADLSGSSRLLGSAEEIGAALLREAEAAGYVANVAIAANPDAALHAARGLKGLTVIVAGEEAQALASLPVAVLEPPEEISEILFHWGISDLRALAALPEIALTERLGQEGLRLQRLAKGATQRELLPAEPPLTFRESMELEEPVELLEPLAFVLNRLLEEAMRRLRERSLATDHLELKLTLELHPEQQLRADGPASTVTSQFQKTLKLPVPSQDAKVLLKLLQIELSASPPPAPVKNVAIEVLPARLRPVQAGLFQPLAPEPAKLEITLARLRAAVGAEDDQGRGRVGFAQPVDSHRPDSFTVLPSGPAANAKAALPETSQLALRRFRPPLPARVEMRAGRPAAISFEHTRNPIVRTAGPWRTSGAWWDSSREWQRDEWDLELNFELNFAGEAGLYRVFQDLRTGEWFVEGMYD
ncbi:MAG TPA: DNA polymerase Y family protein [Candidatus Angelobacter sp.]|nr:DNA polymerase Y family protein [Candidatus Angelobacter sp.]